MNTTTKKLLLIAAAVAIGFVIIGVLAGAVLPHRQVVHVTTAAPPPTSSTTITSPPAPKPAPTTTTTTVPVAPTSEPPAGPDPNANTTMCALSNYSHANTGAGTTVTLYNTYDDGAYKLVFTETDGTTDIEYVHPRFDGATMIQADYPQLAYNNIVSVAATYPNTPSCNLNGE